MSAKENLLKLTEGDDAPWLVEPASNLRGVVDGVIKHYGVDEYADTMVVVEGQVTTPLGTLKTVKYGIISEGDSGSRGVVGSKHQINVKLPAGVFPLGDIANDETTKYWTIVGYAPASTQAARDNGVKRLYYFVD